VVVLAVVLLAMADRSILPNLLKGQKRPREPTDASMATTGEGDVQPPPAKTQRVSSLLMSLMKGWESNANASAPEPEGEARSGSGKAKKTAKEPKKAQRTDDREGEETEAARTIKEQSDQRRKRRKTIMLDILGKEDGVDLAPSQHEPSTVQEIVGRCSLDNFRLLSVSDSSSVPPTPRTGLLDEPIQDHPLLPFFEFTLSKLSSSFHHPVPVQAKQRAIVDQPLALPKRDPLKNVAPFAFPIAQQTETPSEAAGSQRHQRRFNDLTAINVIEVEEAIQRTRTHGNLTDKSSCFDRPYRPAPIRFKRNPKARKHTILFATNIPSPVQYIGHWNEHKKELELRRRMLNKD